VTDHAPTTRSYVPGEWYVVLGADLVLALPPDRRDLAASAWALVDAGAGADEVLDLVLAAGLSDLAGLALVSTEERRTRAVVRGRAVCLLDADGEETVADGRSVTTWAEAGADDVRAISLELGSAATGATLEVGDGLVRAARILWPAEPALAAGPVAAAAGHGVPVPVVDSSPLLRHLAAAEDQGDESPAETPAETPAWTPAADDHDGRTQDGSWSAEEFLRAPAGIPGQPPAPDVTAVPVAVLRISDGQRVDVDRVVILGRAPEARRFTATQQPRLVAVPSPQQEISSTHLEVRPGSGADHGSAVVTDLGSTNGTLLTQPGLPQEPLRPGIPVQLLPGAVIDLGDGLTITVDRP